ncbi:hypothetical protein AQ505_09800 [Pedobacter sp. PACM 27299]|uniref:hypothetical protein n=1 Tax=Pedobacter sp. PACM 27299 TaxID=1727164 RepID=UPI0007069CBC|nr:hypothetical protein [Pedobacter sp. PACM 27299]ALL05759.1 hypothetical protein AQ505_09800 [Pedobacter sp. PACM 27299]
MKKVFFALFAVIIAIGGSAFTNAKLTDPLKVYGNTGDDYTPRITENYNPAECLSLSTETLCAYQVTELGRTTVTASSYTAAQMINFKSLNYVTDVSGPTKGIYDAP